MVEDGPRPELGDGKEARPGDVLVPVVRTAGRDEGGQGQAREAVARQEAFACEVAVGVEVGLSDRVDVGQQGHLRLSLFAQAGGFHPLVVRRTCVQQNGVLGLDLSARGGVEVPPALTGGVERVRNLREDFAQPPVRPPVGPGELLADGLEHLLGPDASSVQSVLIGEGGLYILLQIKGWVFAPDFENLGERPAQIETGLGQPYGVNVGADEVFVGNLGARRQDGSGHHLLRPPEEVAVVRAAGGAVGVDEGRLPASAGTAAALGVVRRGRRYVAQADDVEIGDVHAEFHGRRAEQYRQSARAEPLLTILALLVRHLSCVLSGLQVVQPESQLAVEMHEEGVCLRLFRACPRHPDGVPKRLCAVTGDPPERRRRDLVAGRVALGRLNGFREPGNPEGPEKLRYDLLRLIHRDGLPELGECARPSQVLAEAASSGQEGVAAEVGGLPCARESDGGVLEQFRLIDRPRVSKHLRTAAAKLLLVDLLKVVHPDAEFAAHVVEQRLRNGLAHRRRRGHERGMALAPVFLARAQVVQRLVANLEEAALLQVRRHDPPPAPEVAVQPVSKHVPQGAPGLFLGGVAHQGVVVVRLFGQIQRFEDALCDDIVGESVLVRSVRRPKQGASEERNLDEVVEVPGLQRCVLPIVCEAQQLPGVGGNDVFGHGAQSANHGLAQDAGGAAAAFRRHSGELGKVRFLP